MRMNYRLHYAPDNASLIIRLALEEIGVPYETVLVDRRSRAQDTTAYRALNPAGLIPVLETPVRYLKRPRSASGSWTNMPNLARPQVHLIGLTF